MDWVDEEASARAGNQVGPRAVWRQTLGRFAALNLPPEEAKALARACREPSDVALLVRLLKTSPAAPEPPAERAQWLFQEVDDSDISLAHWIQALRAFYTWLDAEGRRTTLRQALGYIHCSAEGMAGDLAFSSLATGVREMLELYGFEGEESG